MAGIREFSERLWNGEVDDGILYYEGISGSTTLDTGDSLVMIDTGARNDAPSIVEGVRKWQPHQRLTYHPCQISGLGVR